MWWVALGGSAGLCILVMVMKVLEAVWWRPKRLEEHFARQGIRGPPYKFFIGNVREMVALMLDSSSKSVPATAGNYHNILPRVLSFYTHWKKIYGESESEFEAHRKIKPNFMIPVCVSCWAGVFWCPLILALPLFFWVV